ncbi:DUF2948 family protein [Methylocystis bryophila]|uniref:DUF2948 domain-containing protein n=1 Tax=Methylocystis bryophila TaxID=655015 RepID=A0A1W6MYF3_9HYPH|nr:DUF2948 family protein [Methylocystis bryophila]ARN82612.1 hypothetical protein B1812_17660 [Methylocystis bryophila]BDV38825.1 hypothetical protein DSM21852_20780 [Methylocystis bryophila]
MSAVDRLSKPAPLRLQALDPEDLAFLSAHLQDAAVRVGDIAYLKEKRRFALVAARFDWNAGAQPERCAAVLHFDAVRAVRCLSVPRDDKEAMLALLTIIYDAQGAGPEGRIRLIFSGGAVIALDVDSIEAQLSDRGPRWRISSRPSHKLDEGQVAGP